MKLLKLYQEDKLSFILLASSVLCDLLGIVFYLVSQGMMNVKVNWMVLLPAILGIALTLLVLFYKDFDSMLLILSTACSFLAFVLIISSQVVNLGYYFAGITDIGYGLMPTFIVSAIVCLASIVLTSVVVFRRNN